ncbi:MAG: DUF5399 family protein [Chlamydiia bacterium]|jgi:Family of unknown function (DUF5399)
MTRRTIDNLGLDVSTRYAQDQVFLDDKIIKDASAIVPQTQIDVTQPAYPSEFEALFGLSKKNLSWAEFTPPARFNEQKKRLFTHQLIPSLGSSDKKENQSQKIVAKVQAHLHKRLAPKNQDEDQNRRNQLHNEQEDKELEKEKKTLIKLFDCIVYLDKNISFINSRRTQYQKG